MLVLEQAETAKVMLMGYVASPLAPSAHLICSMYHAARTCMLANVLLEISGADLNRQAS